MDYDDFTVWSGKYEGERYTAQVSMYSGFTMDETIQGNIVIYDRDRGETFSADLSDPHEENIPYFVDYPFNESLDVNQFLNRQYACCYQICAEDRVSLYEIGFYSCDGEYYIDFGSIRYYYESLKKVE